LWVNVKEGAVQKRAVVSAIAAVGVLATPARADVVSDWNEKVIALLTNARMAPPQAERVMAMVHVAMFDAVNAIDKRYRPYLIQPEAQATASKEAAAATAAGKVLLGLYPQVEVELKAALAAYLSTLPAGEAKVEGTRLGETVAGHVLAARAQDGSDAPDSYRPKAKPGVYVPTSITVGSVWPKLVPFAMTSPSQFRPQPPVALTSPQWATDFNEIKVFGARESSKRSARQTEDARFWLTPGPVIYYPIVRQIAAAKKLSILDSARLLALVAVARSDAFIAVFDAKYHYDFWRPVTAIRNGDIDDNPATEPDASWLPLADTPMHPEYPCAHCIMASTMAAVIGSLFAGTELPELSLTSPTAPGVTHHWTNLQALVDEVMDARIWAGFHYRFSTRVGAEMGHKIGDYTVRSVMQPTALVR
jgi:PAP2 superfamily